MRMSGQRGDEQFFLAMSQCYMIYMSYNKQHGNFMLRISSGDLQRKIGQIQDMALMEPVTITSKGRDRLVMMAIEEFRRLKRRDREVLRVEDLTQADLEAIRNAEPPPEAAMFDHELTD